MGVNLIKKLEDSEVKANPVNGFRDINIESILRQNMAQMIVFFFERISKIFWKKRRNFTTAFLPFSNSIFKAQSLSTI